MSHTLSFGVLDDLIPTEYVDGKEYPIHTSLPDLSRDSIAAAVQQLERRIKDNDYWLPGYTDEQVFTDAAVNDTVYQLHYTGTDVWNSYEKYYVIAWTIDVAPFYACSKGCHEDEARHRTQVGKKETKRVE